MIFNYSGSVLISHSILHGLEGEIWWAAAIAHFYSVFGLFSIKNRNTFIYIYLLSTFCISIKASH